MAQPLKHHFLPVFYLKRWATKDDRKVVEFRKPYGNEVKPKRVHPRATGFVERLYSIEGLPDEIAQEMERDFLSPIDSKASEALTKMEDGRDFSSSERLAWAGFLATLMTRMPDDIKLFKVSLRELYTTLIPEFESAFHTHKSSTETLSFDQLSQKMMSSVPSRVISFAKKIMSNDRLIAGLAGMDWSILKLDNTQDELLTSDRPVIFTNVLGAANSHLVLPIGPRRLFIAANRREFIAMIKAAGSENLIAATNRAVAEQADQLVYGSSDASLGFVQSFIGTGRIPSLAARMLEMQRAQYSTILESLRAVRS